MNPQNGIIGDIDGGIDIPETEVHEELADEVKSMAKFTRTAEYKRQKAWGEQVIDFYETKLPDGRDISSVPMNERGEHWTVANEVIKVIKGFLASYEESAESAKAFLEKK